MYGGPQAPQLKKKKQIQIYQLNVILNASKIIVGNVREITSEFIFNVFLPNKAKGEGLSFGFRVSRGQRSIYHVTDNRTAVHRNVRKLLKQWSR